MKTLVLALDKNSWHTGRPRKSDNTITNMRHSRLNTEGLGGEAVFMNLRCDPFLFFSLFCRFLKLRSRLCVISGCLSRDLFQRLCQQKSTRVCYEERHTDFYTAYIGLFFSFHSVNIFRGPQLSCNHHRDENRIATEKSRKICDRRFSQQTHTDTHTYIHPNSLSNRNKMGQICSLNTYIFVHKQQTTEGCTTKEVKHSQA